MAKAFPWRGSELMGSDSRAKPARKMRDFWDAVANCDLKRERRLETVRGRARRGARLFAIGSVESPKETANRRLAGVIFLL
jgi:hypothetical protein